LNNKYILVIFVLKVGKPGFNSLADSSQNSLIVDIKKHGRRQGGAVPHPLIFINGTDKVEGGLMVLFFGLFPFPPPPPGNFSADALDSQLPCLTFSIKNG